MLEIILVAAIIATLINIAVPKMARVIDKVTLDYEMKRFYSTLNLARAINRNTNFQSSAFSSIRSDGVVQIFINGTNYELKRNNKNYTLDKHYWANGFKFSCSTPLLNTIYFDESGQCFNYNSKAANGKITLTSKFNDEAKIVFDSVGRFRGTRR